MSFAVAIDNNLQLPVEVFSPRWGAVAMPRKAERTLFLATPQYEVGLAETMDDLRDAQRLRHDVFSNEFGASFPPAAGGIDEDEFDHYCDHIIVRLPDSGQVVGTYRMLLPQQARALRRYYSQNEFFMTRIQRQIPDMVELGRSCVHPEHRSGPVIMMLWSAIVRYMRLHGCHHLVGCASVSMRDGGVTAATLWDRYSREYMVDGMLEAFPKNPLPLERIERASDVTEPPLLRAYLRLGARICGQPSWDPDFNTADFLMLMDLRKTSPRFARHFGLA